MVVIAYMVLNIKLSDRIEAGTYMYVAAAVGEEITINNIVPKHVESTYC